MGLLRSRLAGPRLFERGGGVGGRSQGAELNITLGNPGRCPKTQTLTIGVFDDSGSMLGGADSTGLRYAESTLAFDRISRRCRCGQERVAVLHMNRPNSADLLGIALGKASRAAIAAALTVPADGDGASTLGDTLVRAKKIADEHPGHDTTLIVFSDFELTDDMTALAASLAAFPGDVHAVVMRSTPPPELLAQSAIRCIRVEAGAKPGPVARALFDAITTHRPGRQLSHPSQGR